MKKHSLLTTIILLTPCLSFASENNLFKNSDMGNSGAWRGDRSFVEHEDDRVLKVSANPRRIQSFSQSINTSRLKDVMLKFRYRTEDYQGRGMQIQGHRRTDGHTYNNISLKSDGEWHQVKWRFSEVRGSSSIEFVFQILEGTGTVLFDDITAEPM